MIIQRVKIQNTSHDNSKNKNVSNDNSEKQNIKYIT